MIKNYKQFNESIIPDVLQVAASFLSVLTLVAIPFIPVALEERKREKQRKIEELARKDRKLNSILIKIGRNSDTKNILLGYKSDLQAEDLTKSEKNHIKSEMMKVLKETLSTFEIEYLDELIQRLD